MKKVLLLFTFIFCLLPNNVKAYSSNPVEKPFVCGVGYDYSYLLEYDGYEIISKSVDFFNVGTYYMTYLNKSSKETITKRIDVIDYSNIYENGYYHSNITSLTSPDYLIVDTFTLNNKTYILEIDQYNTNCRNIVITIVEDNKVSLSKIIKESVEASVNKIIVDDESIYILGTIYKEGYSIDFNLVNKKAITASQEELAMKASQPVDGVVEEAIEEEPYEPTQDYGAEEEVLEDDFVEEIPSEPVEVDPVASLPKPVKPGEN